MQRGRHRRFDLEAVDPVDVDLPEGLASTYKRLELRLLAGGLRATSRRRDNVLVGCLNSEVKSDSWHA